MQKRYVYGSTQHTLTENVTTIDTKEVHGLQGGLVFQFSHT